MQELFNILSNSHNFLKENRFLYAINKAPKFSSANIPPEREAWLNQHKARLKEQEIANERDAKVDKALGGSSSPKKLVSSWATKQKRQQLLRLDAPKYGSKKPAVNKYRIDFKDFDGELATLKELFAEEPALRITNANGTFYAKQGPDGHFYKAGAIEDNPEERVVLSHNTFVEVPQTPRAMLRFAVDYDNARREAIANLKKEFARLSQEERPKTAEEMLREPTATEKRMLSRLISKRPTDGLTFLEEIAGAHPELSKGMPHLPEYGEPEARQRLGEQELLEYITDPDNFPRYKPVIAKLKKNNNALGKALRGEVAEKPTKERMATAPEPTPKPKLHPSLENESLAEHINVTRNKNGSITITLAPGRYWKYPKDKDNFTTIALKRSKPVMPKAEPERSIAKKSTPAKKRTPNERLANLGLDMFSTTPGKNRKKIKQSVSGDNREPKTKFTEMMNTYKKNASSQTRTIRNPDVRSYSLADKASKAMWGNAKENLVPKPGETEVYRPTTKKRSTDKTGG